MKTLNHIFGIGFITAYFLWDFGIIIPASTDGNFLLILALLFFVGYLQGRISELEKKIKHG